MAKVRTVLCDSQLALFMKSLNPMDTFPPCENTDVCLLNWGSSDSSKRTKWVRIAILEKVADALLKIGNALLPFDLGGSDKGVPVAAIRLNVEINRLNKSVSIMRGD